MKTKKFNMVPTVILCLLVHVVLLPENSGLASASIQCQDNAGSPVDWFIIYKMPKLSDGYPSSFKSGKGFYYMDEHQTSWYTEQTFDIGSKSALKETLDQIYLQICTLGFDDNTGFWLIHSAPKFPPKKSNSGFSWADNASDNGQMFLCVSFDTKSLNDIAQQLFTMQPKIYDEYISPNTLSTYSKLIHLNKKASSKGKMNASPPKTSILDLYTLGGLKLKSFAKHGTYGNDLYECLVAPKLQTDMKVETWMRGSRLPNSCSTTQYKIYNIQEIKMPPISPGGLYVTFKETKDHSKFAVSLAPGQWVCVGDINREGTQFKRGGGTLCLENQTIADEFRRVVDKVEP